MMKDGRQIVEIRLAEQTDASSIAAVLAASFAEYEPLYTEKSFLATTPTGEQIQNRFTEGTIWAALLNGKIVGTVSVVPADAALHIRSMAILPEARGKKIGERLLENIEKFALENDFKRLILSTTPFLDRATRLYEKFGFAHVGRDDLHGTTLVLMEKNL